MVGCGGGGSGGRAQVLSRQVDERRVASGWRGQNSTVVVAWIRVHVPLVDVGVGVGAAAAGRVLLGVVVVSTDRLAVNVVRF